jgi:hypothetical protein
MQLIHSNIPTAKKAVLAKETAGNQRQRSLKWMAVQYRKHYEKMLRDNSESLKIIHAVEPNWMPGMEM